MGRAVILSLIAIATLGLACKKEEAKAVVAVDVGDMVPADVIKQCKTQSGALWDYAVAKVKKQEAVLGAKANPKDRCRECCPMGFSYDEAEDVCTCSPYMRCKEGDRDTGSCQVCCRKARPEDHKGDYKEQGGGSTPCMCYWSGMDT